MLWASILSEDYHASLVIRISDKSEEIVGSQEFILVYFLFVWNHSPLNLTGIIRQSPAMQNNVDGTDKTDNGDLYF